MKNLKLSLALTGAIFWGSRVSAQDTSHLAFPYLPAGYIKATNSSLSALDRNLQSSTVRSLQRLAKTEKKILRRITVTDTFIFRRFQAGNTAKSSEHNHLAGNTTVLQQDYLSHLDSVGALLRFLQQNPKEKGGSNKTQKDLPLTAANLEQLAGSFQQADAIGEYIRSRNAWLQAQVKDSGAVKEELAELQKTGDDYRAALQQYKDELRGIGRPADTMMVQLKRQGFDMDRMLPHLPASAARIGSPGLFSGNGFHGLNSFAEVGRQYRALKHISADDLAGLSALSLHTEGAVSRSYFNDTYAFATYANAAAGMHLYKIPLAIQYNYQDIYAGGYHAEQRFSFKFNREDYLDGLRDNIRKKFGAAGSLSSQQLFEGAQSQAGEVLQKELNSLTDRFKKLLVDYKTPLGDPALLSAQDPSALFKQLLSPASVRFFKEKEAALRQLRDAKNLGRSVDPGELEKLQELVGAYHACVNVYGKLQGYKEKLAGTRSRLDGLKDPSDIGNLASQYLGLGRLEKLFLQVRQLNIGQSAVSLSGLSLRDYLSTGANAAFLRKNKYFFFIAGKERDFTSVYDQAYSGALIHNDHTLQGMSLGLGPVEGNHTHLSFLSFNRARAGSGAAMLNLPRSSTLVAGLNERFNLDENTVITAEISRSATNYKNAYYGLDSLKAKSTAMGKLLEAGSLQEGLALSAKYSGDYEKIGLSLKAGITHAGGDYYNPGNPFLSRGSDRMNFSLRQVLLKRKLRFSIRGDLRNYCYDEDRNRKWKNTLFTFDTRWSLKKGQYISVKYTPARGVRKEGDTRFTASATDRLAVDMNLQKRLAGTYYRNFLSLSYNRNAYATAPAVQQQSVSLIFSSLQNIFISGKLFYWNITYNRSGNNDAALFFLNSSLNSDLGFTYQLKGGISGSSGLAYSSVKGWYAQVGYRQSLSADMRRFQCSIFSDLRTNVKQFNGYFDDLISLNWSLKYYFK